jgi:ABC-type nitrate/sulfonate/bicarbonate transport system substrate-binding protein
MRAIKKGFRRGIAVALAASAVGVLPAAHSVQAADPTVVKIAHTPASVLGILINTVIDEGLDTKNNFKVEAVPVAAAPAILAGMVGGTIELTGATIDNFIAWHMTTPMTVWRENISAPFWEIIVRKEFAEQNGIKAGSDYKAVMTALAKSNVGVVAKAGASEFMWLQLAGGAGINYSGTIVPGLATAPTIQAALIAKTVDAVITYEPFATLMVQSGYAVSPFSIRDGAKGLPDVVRAPGLSLGGPSSWFNANRAVAVNIDKAFDEAATWLKTPKNFAKAVARLQKYAGVDNTTAIALLKVNLNYFSSTGSMNLEAWNRVGQWYKDTNQPITKGTLLQAKDFAFNLSAKEIKPVKKGASINVTELATSLKLYPRSNSKVTATSFTKKICVVSGASIVTKAAGVCEVGIQVVDKGSKNFQNRSSKAAITVKK